MMLHPVILVIATSTISIIVAAGLTLALAIAAPILLLYFTERARHNDRQQDYDRQDELMERAATAAESLAVSNKQLAEIAVTSSVSVDRKLEVIPKVIQSTANETGRQLKQIHTLVNSNLTASMQGQLDATKRELVTLRELVALRKETGKDVDPKTLEQIVETEGLIERLAKMIAEREEQTVVADQQAKGND
jgi:alkylhydroperoxidase/carboxymuconolactone decarboxylase family protein YurZ